MPRILLLAPYPCNEAPSQRFRFELLLKNTQEKQLHYHFQSFYSPKGWQKLYQSTNSFDKLWVLLLGFARRKLLLLSLHRYDIIYIHRETTPLGPPIFEWLIAKVFRKKIIYDFDDAIWMNDGHDSRLFWWLKSRWKIKKICQWSWKVSVGNEFLAQFARQYCDQVVIIPTIVDTDVHSNDQPKANSQQPIANSQKLTIGWTGSHSTLFYLDSIVPILQALETHYDFNFLVIANRDPELPLKNYLFIKWNKDSEIDDLQKIDIGIMPLEDSEWAKGKCGFKLIQYGALGIPSVASSVGVNEDIITHEENGFLAKNQEDWKNHLTLLLENETARIEMGRKARKVVQEKYSIAAVEKDFLDLFSA
jgi:glycosyltransferase involved in cell wall biosynthesis